MNHKLIGGWNSRPPPTEAFLGALATFLDAEPPDRINAYYAMIESVSSRQDLAQFLFYLSENPGLSSSDAAFNGTTSEYWDGLAGVLVSPKGADLDDPVRTGFWRILARVLNAATVYE